MAAFMVLQVPFAKILFYSSRFIIGKLRDGPAVVRFRFWRPRFWQGDCDMIRAWQKHARRQFPRLRSEGPPRPSLEPPRRKRRRKSYGTGSTTPKSASIP